MRFRVIYKKREIIHSFLIDLQLVVHTVEHGCRPGYLFK